MDEHLFLEIVEKLALGVETAGVAVIVLGFVFVTAQYLYKLVRKQSAIGNFRTYRHGLGRTLLLSLEFLVAADIIRTVAIEEPSFESIGVLGLIILVRTFLSWALELELSGCWPWQQRRRSAEASEGQEEG